MNTFFIKDEILRRSAQEGVDVFLEAISNTIKNCAGGELSAETMKLMNAEQITLLGYMTLKEELMDGGFIQLIHNGWGPFFFYNPFDYAMKQWGLEDLCRLIRRVKKKYLIYNDEIEAEMNDDEFMALYEEFPIFDDFDDEFITNEEQWTNMIACHVDDHMDKFLNIIK